MFRKYGILGILMILFAQINFFLKIQPFANWYFPIIWGGYILVVDAIVYRLKKNSLLSNKPKKFAFLILMSSFFWWIFEFANKMTENWGYSGLSGFGSETVANAFGAISFATVLPAVFETTELIEAVHLFDHTKLHKKHRVTKRLLHLLFGIGILTFLLPLAFPRYFFPLVWVAFFFLLDPINFMHRQPSIIQHLRDRKLKTPLSLAIGGLICGFFWEFWNYWAIPKWTYTIPFVGFLKIFEMPILGTAEMRLTNHLPIISRIR